MQIRFLTSYRGRLTDEQFYVPGAVADLADTAAQQLIAEGVAEAVATAPAAEPDPPAEPPPEAPAKKPSSSKK